MIWGKENKHIHTQTKTLEIVAQLSHLGLLSSLLGSPDVHKEFLGKAESLVFAKTEEA